MLNEMMHRPIVKKEIVAFMRQRQKQLSGKLGVIEKEANEKNVPIIPHETVVFMTFLLGQLKPKKVLEIGCAIGFSAGLMASVMEAGGQVTTIDRFDVMIEKAKKNFADLGIEQQVTLLEGQAADILPALQGSYDFIFMDCAKQKYIEFLPELLRLVRKGGVIMIDDVFQAGTILLPEQEIPRKNRGIHRKLVELMDKTLTHPDLTVSLVPLGDGVMLMTKETDKVDL